MARDDLTVIVPSFNAAEHIGACLDSLRSQSLKDIRVLVVDDASQDDSVRVVEEYVRAHPEFALELHALDTNSGVSVARNVGVQRSRGEFVAFVDPDDTVSEDMFATLLALIRENGSAASACGAQVVRHGERIGELGPGSGVRTRSGIELLARMCRGEFPSSVCFMIFPRTLFERVSFTPGVRFEDYIFLAEALPLLPRIATTDKPLYHYHRRAGTETGMLRESVRDLTIGIAAASDSVRRCYGAHEAERLISHVKIRLARTMAHQAFAFGENTPLARAIIHESLSILSWRDIIKCLISRELTVSLSATALKCLPSLYGRLFLIRHRLKDAAPGGAPKHG